MDLQYYFDDFAEPLSGQLAGYYKVKAGRAGMRIICTKPSDYQVVIHEVSSRNDAYQIKKSV